MQATESLLVHKSFVDCPSLVVMGEDKGKRDCEFESQNRIQDGHFSFVEKFLLMFFRKDRK